MAFFGKANRQEPQVRQLINLASQLYQMTTESDEVRDFLKFELPDSRFRYLLFCLSAVHIGCASLMKNPDAVLNDAAFRVANYCCQESETFFGDEPDPQVVANRTARLLQDFLNRWSAWFDIATGDSSQAGDGIVANMIHECESAAELESSDTFRLLYVASWIIARFPDAREVFKSA